MGLPASVAAVLDFLLATIKRGESKRDIDASGHDADARRRRRALDDDDDVDAEEEEEGAPV